MASIDMLTTDGSTHMATTTTKHSHGHYGRGALVSKLPTALCLASIALILAFCLAIGGTCYAAESAVPVASDEASPAPSAEGTPVQESSDEGGTITGKTILDTLQRGGWLMAPIFLCSVIGLAFTLERFVSLFVLRRRILPKVVPDQVLHAVTTQGVSAAEEICKADGSAFARVVGAGLHRAHLSLLDMEKAIEDTGARLLWDLRKNARPLGIIATVAPLLGLLGTVVGMVEAFDVVAQKGALGNPKELASGIAKALLTTGFGLAAAIPFLLLYHFFRGRAETLMREIEEKAVEIVVAASAKSKPRPAESDTHEDTS